MIAVDWGSLEETFLVWRIEGLCALDDLQSAYRTSFRLIRSKNYPVQVIADIRTAQLDNQWIKTALDLHHEQAPPNLTKTIILYHHAYYLHTFRLLENFYPNLSRDFILTTSVDEAYLLVLPAA